MSAAIDVIPCDVESIECTHDGRPCSFDAILKKYRLTDPALRELAAIVRGANPDRHELAPLCAGLFAISVGLSCLIKEDHEQLRHGLVIYDALYAWATRVGQEKHHWNPQRTSP